METFKDFLKHLLQSKTLKNQVTRFNGFNCYCNNTQLCVIFFSRDENWIVTGHFAWQNNIQRFIGVSAMSPVLESKRQTAKPLTSLLTSVS